MSTVLERLSFSGHQTFPFRYGWLPKGVRLAAKDPRAFLHDGGMVKLGVGKNMVASIRHWCEALGLIRLDGRSGRGEVLPLGCQLFGSGGVEGVDPYLEDVGTLWLLHWQLCKRPFPASAWYLAFTRWNRPVFTREDLVSWLHKLTVDTGDRRTSRASIRRDVDVLLRSYTEPRLDGRRTLEDTFDCPLVELGLVSELERGLFVLQRGARPSLPREILAVAVEEFWLINAPEQNTLSFERLMFDPGSPGAAFQLSEGALAGMLEGLPKSTGIGFDDSSGMRRITRLGKKRRRDVLAGLLRDYYQSRSGAQ